MMKPIGEGGKRTPKEREEGLRRAANGGGGFSEGGAPFMVRK